MTVKIVRMTNGEDVIADLKEIRKDEDTPGAVAYVFEKPYTVQIIDNTQSQMLFEEPGDTTDPSPKKINDLEIKFYPFFLIFNKILASKLAHKIRISNPFDKVNFIIIQIIEINIVVPNTMSRDYF